MLRVLRLFILSLPFLSLVSAVAIPVVAPVKRATVCNGHESLCDRPYSNVTFIGSHDSFAFTKKFAIGKNQEVDIPTQLSLGVRLLQAQSHQWGNDLKFCHTSCLIFDGGKVIDYLKTVKSWLDKNPSEVLTLIFTNPEKKSVKDVWKPLFERSGISGMAYVPPEMPLAVSGWPTLGEMIESGKRVVVFMDKGASTPGGGAAVDFILPQFEHVWETQYSVTDASFPCKVDRIKGPFGIEDHMFLINHSLNKNILPIGPGIIVPDYWAAKDTNSRKSILAHAYDCDPMSSGRAPNFVLIDWVDRGEAFKAANTLNGLD